MRFTLFQLIYPKANFNQLKEEGSYYQGQWGPLPLLTLNLLTYSQTYFLVGLNVWVLSLVPLHTEGGNTQQPRQDTVPGP